MKAPFLRSDPDTRRCALPLVSEDEVVERPLCTRINFTALWMFALTPFMSATDILW